MNKLAIIGASGHGKVVSDIAKKNGYTEIAFLDDMQRILSLAVKATVDKDYNAGARVGEKGAGFFLFK